MDEMKLTNAQRAGVLVQALPYIQKYYGKIVVIKYGGNAMLNEELKSAVMGDLALLSLIGVKVVLVHGGGPEITDMLARVGKKTEFVNGLRVTDAETAEIVQMVLAGKINKSLVNKLENIGANAIGLSGADGHMIEAAPLSPALGYVGEITAVNVKPITDMLEKGYIPVISTVGCDREGNVYNINADTAAARLAGALEAESLICMTDTAGIMRNCDDPDSLIPVIDVDGIASVKLKRLHTFVGKPHYRKTVKAEDRSVKLPDARHIRTARHRFFKVFPEFFELQLLAEITHNSTHKMYRLSENKNTQLRPLL